MKIVRYKRYDGRVQSQDIEPGIVVEHLGELYLRVRVEAGARYKFVALRDKSWICLIEPTTLVRVVDCTLVEGYKGEADERLVTLIPAECELLIHGLQLADEQGSTNREEWPLIEPLLEKLGYGDMPLAEGEAE